MIVKIVEAIAWSSLLGAVLYGWRGAAIAACVAAVLLAFAAMAFAIDAVASAGRDPEDPKRGGR